MTSGHEITAESLLPSSNFKHKINTSGHLKHQKEDCNWTPFSCFVKVPTGRQTSGFTSDPPIPGFLKQSWHRTFD